MLQSGAIFIYLAEKTGNFLPGEVRGRSSLSKRPMFQMSAIGPMMGQANAFCVTFPNRSSGD